MKKYRYLFLLSSLALILSCNDDVPNSHEKDGLSIFKVIYSHSGDGNSFYKSLEVGENFKFLNSNIMAPTTLFDEDILDSTYVFINTKPVKEIELAVMATWNPTKGDNKIFKVTLQIYRDTTLLDTKVYVTTSEKVSSENRIQYKGI